MSSGSDRKEEHDENLGTIHFIPDMENRHKFVKLHHKDLLAEFRAQVPPSDLPDKINRIWVYETPLSAWQPTYIFFYHSFTVMAMESGAYYSIETSRMNLTLQRSKSWRHFLLYSCGDEDLLQYLYDRDRLNLKYNLIYENCKDLAKWLFDRFNSEKQIYRLIFTSY